MDFEFDKEMDSLLRQMAKGESASIAPENAHIDADEISLFAENALPEKARPRMIKHLADCGRCRTILSNVIALNAEAETENAASVSSAEETQAATAVVSTTEIPWYRKLFATRNLAFGMGALALIFAVGIGFLVVQNSMYSAGEMAQANTNTETANASTMTESAPSADAPDTKNANVAMGSNMEMTAADTNSAANVGADSAETVSDEKQTLGDSKAKDAGEGLAKRRQETSGRKDSKRDNSADKIATSEITTVEETDDDRIIARTDRPKNEDRQPAEKNETQLSPPPTANKPSITSNSATPGAVARTKKTTVATDDEEKEAKKKSEESTADRKVNGRNFTYKNGVWTDSAYTGQKTKSVKRGTSAYRNLDRGLQSIGNQLYGTVIVVWKSKAYKIE